MKARTKELATFLAAACVLVLSLTAGISARSPQARPPHVPGDFGGGPQRFPAPTTIDQITQNVGNIATTVDNWGYVGGYSYLGLPSGEWPRGSGHSYLAEVRYWIGGVTPAGDTLVANTYDDFQGMADLATAADHRILLSSDTSRYYAYDPSDTLGLSLGNPANGWRIWNPDSAAWVYNTNYNPLDSTFFPGGPTSFQESFYRFNDIALNGTSLLGLEMTHEVLQWNLCYNQNFMFVILNITNTSSVDYTDFAFGLYIDMDVGGPDGSGENGRLDDVVAFDSTENLAWTYDVKGWDAGWGGPSVSTGVMGTKLLETPDNIGMTAFRTDDWALLPDDDPGRFAMINSTQFDQSLPPTDQFYIQCTRGINLSAGKTVRVVYAIVAGKDEADFRANAELAQQLYDNFYVGPQPPATPTLSARAGDGKVYLSWNDTAEVSLDPLSGQADFSGYKLYRSDNQGKTWGKPIYNTGNNCLDLDYSPLAMYTVASPGDPVQHSIIDSGLYNGVEYWYCLAAFDAGDDSTGVDALQSGFGSPGQSPNVVAVRPQPDPAGYFEAAGTVTHAAGNGIPSEGQVIPILFDRSALTGSEFKVVFEDRPEATYWHLIDVTTGDTVLADQTRDQGDPGMYEVADGLRVVVRNPDRVPLRIEQSNVAASQANLVVLDDDFLGPTTDVFFGQTFGDQHYRSTYELRYTGVNTIAEAINIAGPQYDVPFEAWNTTTNQRIFLAVYDVDGDGLWEPYDYLSVVNYPYDSTQSAFAVAWPDYFSWLFRFDQSIYNPSVGDVFTIEGPKLNGPSDVFSFKVDGVSSRAASADLKDIKVVPNPYFARYSPLVETGQGESVLYFNNLPDQCTIRIYTLAGDLVTTLEHNDGTGAERWNLQSNERRQIASGTYIFHVESPYGEHLGRFAVIK